MSRRTLQDALLTHLRATLPELTVEPLRLRDFQSQLAQVGAAALWVQYLGAEHEAPVGPGRAGVLRWSLIVVLRDYADPAGQDGLDLVDRVDAVMAECCLSGGVPTLERDGIIEAPEGVQGLVFHELTYRVHALVG